MVLLLPYCEIPYENGSRNTTSTSAVIPSVFWVGNWWDISTVELHCRVLQNRVVTSVELQCSISTGVTTWDLL